MNATRLARGVGSVALMVALLAAAMLVYSTHERDYDNLYAPMSSSGAVGQTVTSGPFSVKVDKVTVAKSVSEGAYRGYGKPLTTSPSAIFVVVDARVQATTEATKLPTVYLQSGNGIHYGPSEKGSQTKFTDSIAEPGFWTVGAWLFEVPRAALPGVRLEVSPRATDDYPAPQKMFPHYGFELMPQADVDLGISGGKATTLLAHPAVKAQYKEPEQ
ncbi:MAG TPA: hypothetical protein VGL93_25450 [Streptosporangiaceae bacterium]|jgi:hypothetical protein